MAFGPWEDQKNRSKDQVDPERGAHGAPRGDALPIAYDDGSTDARRGTGLGDLVAPEREHKVERGHLERDQQRLVEEIVPADHETKSLVAPDARQADEAARHGHVGAHLRDRVIDKRHDAGVQRVGEEEAAGTALDEALADGHEEAGADGAADGDQLDLPVVQSPVQAVRVVPHGGAIAGAGGDALARGSLLGGLEVGG